MLQDAKRIDKNDRISSPASASGAYAAHSHTHSHTLTREKLRLGFFLTVAILLVEVIGGMLAHSLALFSDAGHVLTDAAALGLAWFAAAQSERPANARRTYGYHRVGILTALANGVTLILLAAGIAVEAYQRFLHPQQIQPGIVIVAAALAIIINLYIGFGLQKADHENLNTRAATLHVFNDVGASAAVVVGALVIVFTGAQWVDPLLSLIIALLVVVSAVRLVRETLNILLEATPHDLSLSDMVRDMRQIPGVIDVHDLHVWTIASGMRALSCHVIIDDLPPSCSAPILDTLTHMLRDRYRIAHTTIQFESTEHTSHEGFCACTPTTCEGLYCDLRSHSEHQPEHAHAH
jgi:cobalt-zinc-cadmium efflux system protein